MNIRIIRLSLGAIGIGLLIWAFVIPLFTSKTANEKITDIPQKTVQSGTPQPSGSQAPTPGPQVLTTTAFVAQNNEHIEGRASLIRSENTYFIRLEDDFKVTNGPDLYVGFGSNGKVDLNSLFTKLKANNGGQNYEVPSNIDPNTYTDIFVYCKFFKVSFGYAPIEKR